MATPKPATPFNDFTVEDDETPTGKSATTWARVGAAFPHHEGAAATSSYAPMKGRRVVLAPSDAEREATGCPG
ncbi:MAG TPA: hypothetical protein VK820_00855 [Steroidobacteraceae bacterium]|jgi:hypothetical protein|nr:hypothetical protein [Steroidobacteraceae bacterium]